MVEIATASAIAVSGPQGRPGVTSFRDASEARNESLKSLETPQRRARDTLFVSWGSRRLELPDPAPPVHPPVAE